MASGGNHAGWALAKKEEDQRHAAHDGSFDDDQL
jgi:hypothetical protein